MFSKRQRRRRRKKIQKLPPPYISMIGGSELGFANLLENTYDWYYNIQQTKQQSLSDSTVSENIRGIFQYLEKCIHELPEVVGNNHDSPSMARLEQASIGPTTRWASPDSFNQILFASFASLENHRFGGARAFLLRYDNHAATAINPVDFNFKSVEEVIRWLGFGRIYDDPDRCLFSYSSLEGVEPEEIIEIPIRVPLLDTTDAPLARIHRGILVQKSWDCTSMGCDYNTPHHRASASLLPNGRERICAVTGVSYPLEENWWSSEGACYWLIPVCDKVKLELLRFRNLSGHTDGYPIKEWSTSLFPPRVLARD